MTRCPSKFSSPFHRPHQQVWATDMKDKINLISEKCDNEHREADLEI